ncbi:MAG: hypothetical protein ACRERV_03440 [Methylococcales bacterium]
MVFPTKNMMRSLQLILLLFPFANSGALDFAVVSGDAGKVYFDIDRSIDYGTADLRVSSPDDNVSVQLFDHREVPVYPLDDAIPADGRYNYELTLNPAAQAKKALKSSKSTAGDKNGRARAAQISADDVLPQAQVQSGGFAIENGAMIPPTTEE